MKGLRKFVVIGIVGIVLVGVGYILLKPGEKTNGQASNGGQVIRYEKVTRGDLNLTVSADGVVQPIKKVEIKSKARVRSKRSTSRKARSSKRASS